MLRELGAKVRRLRKALHRSQEGVATDVRALAPRFSADLERVDQTEISRIETGRKAAAPWELAALAVVLGVSADYLLGLTDELGGTRDDPSVSI